MKQNILKILDIKTWDYQVKKYLIIKNKVFKYYYQSKNHLDKSLLLIDLHSFSKEKLLEEIIFYFKNYSNWDVALLDSNSNMEDIKYISNAFESSKYKKIIIVGNSLKENLEINKQNKINFLDNMNSKKELWNYIQ